MNQQKSSQDLVSSKMSLFFHTAMNQEIHVLSLACCSKMCIH